MEEVTVHSFGDIEELHDLAETFPNIRWLSLPAIHLPSEAASTSGPPHPVPWTKEEVLDVLPRFKKLEVFRGGALWRASSSSGASGDVTEEDKVKMHDTLNFLVQLCPMLREVDHCDWYERREGFKRVVVERTVVSVPCAIETAGSDNRKAAEDDAAKSQDSAAEQVSEEVEAISYSVKRPFVKYALSCLILVPTCSLLTDNSFTGGFLIALEDLLPDQPVFSSYSFSTCNFYPSSCLNAVFLPVAMEPRPKAIVHCSNCRCFCMYSSLRIPRQTFYHP